MKPKQQAKSAEPEVRQDKPEAERPLWFLGRELNRKSKTDTDKADKPPAKKPRAGKTAEAEVPGQPAEDPPDRRPSQLEAYMRYVKMREPGSEDQLAPIGGRRIPPVTHETVIDENDIDWDDEPPRRRPAVRRAAGGLRVRDAVFAGIASVAVGALAGAVVYDRTNDSELSQAAFDTLGHFVTGLNLRYDANAAANDSAPGIQQASQGTAASFRKPVATASLDVSDAKGLLNTPIPLSISAEPALPDQDIALRLTGLPADAYLTAGTKLANNAWLLKRREALGVKLMVPSAGSASLLIAVEAIEARTGDLAAPTEEIIVALGGTTPAKATQIVPASAPPTDVQRNFNLPPPQESAAAQPIPAPLESRDKTGATDSTMLMRNGDKLLGIGDFTAARAFFSRARELGNPEASLRLGQTYDPIVFRERNVQGLKANPTIALKYYLEARVAGIADADEAINGLESWLKQ
jgi:hypothetical protein